MDTNAKNRRIYIAQAAVEYLIALLVEGAYLSRMTMALGMSDALTGIIHSIISLGNLFGLLSMLYRKRTVKKFVVGMSIANQLLFLILYIVPITGTAIPSKVKSVAFVVFFILAYVIYNMTHPIKTNWLMSAVDNAKRGIFTANKEIVSLVAGIAFSYVMGIAVDYFVERDNLHGAFILCAAVIFVNTVIHTLLLCVYPETEKKAESDKRSFKEILALFKDKRVISITVLFSLWYFAKHVASPFYGTYMLSEMKFAQTFIATMSSLGSVARILISRFFGKYADKHSFSALLRICYAIETVAFAAIAFAAPSVGVPFFIGYHILNGIAMAGINSSMINLVFDLVEPEKRANTLALTQAVAGTVGFLSTIIVSPLVDKIQANGNKFLGMNVYAQQVCSVIAAAFCIICLLYTQFVMLKMKRVKEQNNEG